MQDGCDFRCAYCIVPAARGGPVSRPLGLVLGELRALAAAGYREVTLTGANLGLYHDGRHGLADALRAAAAVEGIARIRLSSIEITTAEREVIACMAESPSFCRFLHLPLQTGDDRLLRAMGRRYTAAEYRDRLEHALDRLPRLGLGTDVIVGLPGEDDRAFDNTLRLLADYPFSNVHVFPYSPRPGTRAAAMPGQVPPALRRERARRVAELALEKRRAFAGSWVGATVAVLVEEVSADGEGTGWTSERIEARVRGKDLAANRIVTAPAAACAGDVLFIDG
jgi:threonylcarbamoyladenosine tRNA methylthiotransferase MtaB